MCTEYRNILDDKAATRRRIGIVLTISIAWRISRSSIRHARFPLRSRPKSRNESRLVAICTIVFAVVCVVCVSLRCTIPESFLLPSSSRGTQSAMRRVASRCTVYVYLVYGRKRGIGENEGGGEGKSSGYFKVPPESQRRGIRE